MNFDHLDDPAGFVPDDSFRAAALGAGRRRRTRRRLALAGGSVLTSVAVLVAAVAGFGVWRTSQIDRVEVEFTTPRPALDQPFNLLLVGTDLRPGQDPASVGGSRTDTMIVVRIDPATRQVTMLSLPRDLVVTPRGGGGPARLNTAFAEGGPEGLVATVEERLGIPLSAYVEVDFEGLVQLVDAVGGIPLSIVADVRDLQTGLRLQPGPCATVDGETTLALLRSRHLERYDGTRWIEDPSADLGRMTRQRAVIAALLPRLGQLADGLGGIATALDVAASHLTIDERLDMGTLRAVADWASEPAGVVTMNVDLTVATATLADGAYVLVAGAGAPEAVRAMGGELPVDARQPGGVGPDPGTTAAILTDTGLQPVGPCE